MKKTKSLAALAAFSLLCAVAPTAGAQDSNANPAAGLKQASEFQSIADPAKRSVALFEEAGKVIQHPRCINCHPATDRPLQTMSMRVHQPPVTRGDGGMGMPGMTCNTCHGTENVSVVGQADTLKSIPGHPSWHLAPIEMAWEGKSLGDICLQLKDPERNGGKTMAQMIEHMADDSLVGWGWNPGEGREPAPGSQEVFGQLIAAWVETGAGCPAP
ncbi:Isoquinoline 1-oxidoreductase subunit [Rhizobium sp. TRM95111]|uniref:Isoquinoline 1-oxidoreductase subunit n=1 Tax=Rhizobium alarense TaxID=2846851 RepID=UPI001F33EBB2|nr:Isoquinoline 1-oxidoreductase subunit [Rhizobium alarense]MCF3640703.1 Isoquinoline 1-oxidoreductase subunit [Rhizobium alarense]